MDEKEFVMATKERQRLRRASRGRGEAGEEQDRHEGDEEEGLGDEVSSKAKDATDKASGNGSGGGIFSEL